MCGIFICYYIILWYLGETCHCIGISLSHWKIHISWPCGCLSSRRYLALCVGETRVRIDLQEPPRPHVTQNHDGNPSKSPLSPSVLRFLSQVGFWTHTSCSLSLCDLLAHLSPLSPRQLLSLHIGSLNVMVLNLLLPESLWHMTSTAITLLFDHQCKRYKYVLLYII